MNNNITLNASMRSNLLSLRNISKQMDKTQLILATGKKVNSAIDNASSYYQARSLSNRAADLTALLDAMGQGIQTIEAATQGLTSGLEFLEQASAVVTEAMTVAVPEKEWFIEQVGENGAVVSTEQELRDAIAAGKETICVYGAIDLGDISTSGGLTLKANQKLVGVGYFGNYDTTTDKFSSITATASIANINLIAINQDNCTVSNLSLNYKNTTINSVVAAVALIGYDANAIVENMDIKCSFPDDKTNNYIRCGITTTKGATASIRGFINIDIFGKGGYAIASYEGGSCTIEEKADVLLKTHSDVQTVRALAAWGNSNIGIAGKVLINNHYGQGIYLMSNGNNSINIYKTAEIYFNTTNQAIANSADGGKGANILNIEAGAKLAFEKDGNVKWYKVKEDYRDENASGTTHYISFDNVESTLNVENVAAWSLPEVIAEMTESTNGDLSGYSASYQKILDEYDNLILDSSYQGINLLNGALKEITLNENRSNKYKVEGKDMSTANIGLTTVSWENQSDIIKSLEEITKAVNSIRSFQEELGNHYSIIKTRIDFTEAMTDVLETGADNLTLADMNEASAEYLTLQTLIPCHLPRKPPEVS